MLRLGILVLLLVCWNVVSNAQSGWRIVSYNVENLFDTRNDSLSRDDDFTPWGKQHWTEAKYKDKLLKLGRALTASGGTHLPVIIGLCEVENRGVLLDLISKTSLVEGNYGIVHQDSPDRRGIDVAFLYRKDDFVLLNQQFLPVLSKEDAGFYTRDILYACGILAGRDTFHFYVCHFPSMSGGEVQSEWKRLQAARVLRAHVDCIQEKNPQAAVVIMGDLNGKADRPAQIEGLRTKKIGKELPLDTCLYNTGFYLLHRNQGSYKYKGNWQTIDHIIVSGVLLNKHHAFQAEPRLKVFEAPFLMEEDKAYFGLKPFRTYLGPRYHGGYSDHLPVYLDLTRQR